VTGGIVIEHIDDVGAFIYAAKSMVKGRASVYLDAEPPPAVTFRFPETSTKPRTRRSFLAFHAADLRGIWRRRIRGGADGHHGPPPGKMGGTNVVSKLLG
jgi:hypothetical protein